MDRKKDIFLDQAPVGTYEITVGDEDYTIDVQEDDCEWSFTKEAMVFLLSEVTRDYTFLIFKSDMICQI